MAEDDSILPTKGLYLDSTQQGLYEDAINQLIKDLGYPVTLYLTPTTSDCPNCFEAGTLVKTPLGYKNIEDIKIGDSVLDHLGQIQTVDKLYSRDYSGSFTKLKIEGYTNMFSSTSNHKVVVERSGNFVKVPSEELKTGDMLVFPLTKYSDEDLKFINIKWENYTNKGFTINQVEEVRELALAGAEPMYISNKTGISVHSVKNVCKKNYKPRVAFNDDIKIDDDVLFAIGWFIAEGCVHLGSGYPRQFSYCLNSEKEEWVADKLIRIFNEKFGITGVKEFRENAKNLLVNFYSTEFSKLLLEQIGHTSENKQIPDYLYNNLNLKQLTKLVEYMVAGDGNIVKYKNTNVVRLTTISNILCNQVFSIWQSNKYLPYVSKSDSYVDKKGISRKDTYRISYSTNPNSNLTKRRVKCHYETRPMLSSIDYISRAKVYNFRVTNTHSYIANGVAVGNCGISPDGRSDGKYNSGNPNTINTSLNRSFPLGAICPICAGRGKLLTEDTKIWTALIKYNPDDWAFEETGIKKTEVARLKTRIESRSDVENATKVKIEGNFYQLEGDPIQKGLQTRTFLTSFWKRIE